MHLAALFVPFFLAKPTTETCVVCNVTSGLAFVPLVAGPVYSATKAALHQYTLSLRWSLEGTHVRVVEIVPPAVKTNLGGSHDFGERQRGGERDTDKPTLLKAGVHAWFVHFVMSN